MTRRLRGTRPLESGPATHCLTAWSVRQWALDQGATRNELRALWNAAWALCASRLVQSLAREHFCTVAHAEGAMHFGQGEQIVAQGGPALYGRLDLRPPWRLVTPARTHTLPSAGAFLRAVARIVPQLRDTPEGHRLRQDFHNSLANLLLNRLLHRLRPPGPDTPEPVHEGHHTYPFPALRVGPALEDIVACSPLNRRPVALALVELDTLLLTGGDAAGAYREALGLPPGEQRALLPVHPWQLKLSPVLGHLLAHGQARLCSETLEAWPLASQRTCRLRRTGFDIKLPVDADLTGERRLLYRLNCTNAGAMSRLVRGVVARNELAPVLTCQYDVAALHHPVAELVPSLSAIVRAPLLHAGSDVRPAIHLWAGLRLADTLVPRDVARAERFLLAYCATLFQGPLRLLVEHGIAIEPHLQNSLFVFEAGLPVRLVLRDLDATILDADRWRAATDGPDWAHDTWDHMPPFEAGRVRTLHALFYGHLGCVTDFYIQHRQWPQPRVRDLVEQVWAGLVRAAATPPDPAPVEALLMAARHTVRPLLDARLRRAM